LSAGHTWLLQFLLKYIRTLISDEKGKFDELVEEKGVKVLIDPKALMHVIGTKMDYVDDPLKYGSYYTHFVLTLFFSFQLLSKVRVVGLSLCS
jgi:hypothetical protein